MLRAKARSIMVERAGAAAAAGLDSLFVGDHHGTGPGTYYQNVPILARLLAEWGERPGGWWADCDQVSRQREWCRPA